MTATRARLFLWLTATATVCIVAFQARHALLPFALGALIAYALAPLVEGVIRFVPIHSPERATWRRGIGVLIVYLVFFVALLFVALALVPIATRQVTHFIDTLPAITESAREQSLGLLNEYRSRTPPEIQDRLATVAEEGAAAVGALVGHAIQGTVTTVTSTLSFLFGFAVVPFWMFYAMRDRRFAGLNLVTAAPAEVREDVRLILILLDRLLGRYLRGQLFLGLVVGVSVGVLMAILRVDLSLGLGVWAGVTELIPIIGPWLGAIPGILIIAATNPELLPWVALAYFLVQQVENNLLVPRIQGEALDLHPAMVILLLVVGGAVWGLLGLVVVIPAAAMLRELFWYADRRLRGYAPETAFAASHLMGGKREEAHAIIEENIAAHEAVAEEANVPAPGTPDILEAE